MKLITSLMLLISVLMCGCECKLVDTGDVELKRLTRINVQGKGGIVKCDTISYNTERNLQFKIGHIFYLNESTNDTLYHNSFLHCLDTNIDWAANWSWFIQDSLEAENVSRDIYALRDIKYTLLVESIEQLEKEKNIYGLKQIHIDCKDMQILELRNHIDKLKEIK